MCCAGDYFEAAEAIGDSGDDLLREACLDERVVLAHDDQRGAAHVAQGRAQGGSDEGGSAFAPVIVDAGAAYPQVPIAPVCSSGSPVIEVLIGAATVRVPPGSDAGILQAVLRILMAAT